ncbi:MAG TPA: NTF2-like N-terminal transpeptidase domain-containing protein, partial [Clostridia bacterium]|nr:NTF2-like N-terminal transpeptidase domain-containing protein [Clostridia bacterium]
MKKRLIGLLIFIILISLIPTGCFGETSSRESVSDLFLDYLESGKYEDMYFLLSRESMQKISKEDFVSRYTAIMDAIGLKSIRTTRYPVQYGHTVSTRPYKAVFDTEKCGVLVYDYAMDIKMSNEEWTIDWNPSLIFPCMQWGDKVYLSAINPVRGEIFDTESNVLAGNQPGYTAYALLSALDDIDGFAAEASIVLGITADEIKEAIDTARSKGEQIAILKQYLPFSLTQEQRDKIVSVAGMGLDNKNLSSFRYYPLAGKAAHLIGYVGSITQDDLNSGMLDGYDQVGPIGRSGLEQAYDLQLRGKPGLELYVLTSEGKRRQTLYRVEPENGKDLVLSIDTALQIKAAELMETHFTG